MIEESSAESYEMHTALLALPLQQMCSRSELHTNYTPLLQVCCP